MLQKPKKPVIIDSSKGKGLSMDKTMHAGRYEVMMGFNTKQYWIYDNVEDCFIDPPIGYEKFSDIEENELQKVVDGNPDWLYDEDHRYYDEDFEI